MISSPRTCTTTVEAKSGYGLTLEDELKILRAIKLLDSERPLRYVPTFLGAHDIPPEYKSRRENYVSLLVNEMLPRVAAEKLAEYCDVFCEANVFTSVITEILTQRVITVLLRMHRIAGLLRREIAAELVR